MMRARLAMIVVVALSAGCAWYVDTVECMNGTVLNERDECVAPPLPDGGVAVVTCEDLCALASGFSETQLTCLATHLEIPATPPASCLALIDEASCGTCIADLAASDETCASAAAICQ